MNTQEYLRTVAPKQPFMQVQLSQYEKMQRWVYDHSKGIEKTEVAALLLGVGAIVALPLTLPVLGAGATTIAVIGGVLAVAAAVSRSVLRLFVPHAHNISYHTFEEEQHLGGRLYYKHDTAILELQGSPYMQGKAQGVLLCEALGRMLLRWSIALKAIGWPKANMIPDQIAEIQKTIPEEILQEMKGLVDGYSSKRKWYHPKLTLSDLILYNMIPDQLHFTPEKASKVGADLFDRLQMARIACTTIAGKDTKEGIVLGRNMDWASLGIMGEMVYLKKTKYAGKIIVEVSAPGLMGAVTGMNSDGLSISMNVNPTKHLKKGGMPAAILMRLCLKNCKTVDEVMRLLEKHYPMGSFHMSVADKNGAKCISFYQGKWTDAKKDPGHLVKTLSDDSPMCITNAQYAPDGKIKLDMWYSRLRQKGLKSFFENAKEKIKPQDHRIAELIPWALKSIPMVNNSETNYFAVMKPSSLSLDLRVSHSFAANARNVHFSKDVLFS